MSGAANEILKPEDVPALIRNIFDDPFWAEAKDTKPNKFGEFQPSAHKIRASKLLLQKFIPAIRSGLIAPASLVPDLTGLVLDELPEGTLIEFTAEYLKTKQAVFNRKMTYKGQRLLKPDLSVLSTPPVELARGGQDVNTEHKPMSWNYHKVEPAYVTNLPDSGIYTPYDYAPIIDKAYSFQNWFGIVLDNSPGELFTLANVDTGDSFGHLFFPKHDLGIVNWPTRTVGLDDKDKPVEQIELIREIKIYKTTEAWQKALDSTTAKQIALKVGQQATQKVAAAFSK